MILVTDPRHMNCDVRHGSKTLGLQYLIWTRESQCVLRIYNNLLFMLFPCCVWNKIQFDIIFSVPSNLILHVQH